MALHVQGPKRPQGKFYPAHAGTNNKWEAKFCVSEKSAREELEQFASERLQQPRPEAAGTVITSIFLSPARLYGLKQHVCWV